MQTFKSVSIGAIMALALLVSACKTIEGVGPDAESAGGAIEDTARNWTCSERVEGLMYRLTLGSHDDGTSFEKYCAGRHPD